VFATCPRKDIVPQPAKSSSSVCESEWARSMWSWNQFQRCHVIKEGSSGLSFAEYRTRRDSG